MFPNGERMTSTTLYSGAPQELLQICNRWSRCFEAMTDSSARVDLIRGELPGLLQDSALFRRILEDIISGNSYPDIRQAMMFENEILLYVNPRRLFSVRLYLYGPGDFTPIHDHSSWGVSGSALGSVGVVTYVREDDGSVADRACIRESFRLELPPGRTVLTLPLDAGIHQTGNPTERPVIMVSVYGAPMRRLFINCFDAQHQRVSRMYPPRIRKRMLAGEALDRLSANGAME
jgi:predicted metal-dependent enzyme (double-stranded beta helix superfamily)